MTGLETQRPAESAIPSQKMEGVFLYGKRFTPMRALLIANTAVIQAVAIKLLQNLSLMSLQKHLFLYT